ncbi:sigma-E factor negative regulatory protein [Otariodibacter oris]|uniref:Anti-sigma-E factor RseA n=1 Tax=Otariodibacter oris TaxID=1032623 RepID=A0A420XFY2_9PAST|nr:RseA family anti-sigma factor [Otariodibacter oris]QGM80273.1 transcriptional regulator [Otariodibacter oris]RKR71639.1 sigma-E factor negative regulatory protein RseA [Otariodibacter oris]
MQQRETLSAYMDGHNVEHAFTDTLCKSEELQQKWANYHAIRSVMRGEEIILGSDFSAKLEAAIEKEEISTQAEKPKGLLLKLKGWKTPIMQMGIAASVCLVAVFGANIMTAEQEVAQVEQPVLQTLPFSNSVQQVSYNAPSQTQPTPEQLEYQQRRINALLQNHELQRRTNVGAIVLSAAEKARAQTSATTPNTSENDETERQQ